MASIEILSDFGGPSVPMGFREELTRIVNITEKISLDYAIDLSLYFGADFLDITDATGIYSPKVMVPKKTAKCIIQFNNNDVVGNPAPEPLLRKMVYAALAEMIERIGKKDSSFDTNAAMKKIAALSPAG